MEKWRIVPSSCLLEKYTIRNETRSIVTYISKTTLKEKSEMKLGAHHFWADTKEECKEHAIKKLTEILSRVSIERQKLLSKIEIIESL